MNAPTTISGPLSDLIARVEGAEAGSREVDRELHEAMTGECTHRETEYYCIEDGNDCDSGFTCVSCHLDTYGNASKWPTYTSSVDAALALIERVRPGVWWIIGKGKTRAEERLYGAELLFGTDEKLGAADHDDLCCCLILALLKSMEAEHG